jgi:hypothetical protein
MHSPNDRSRWATVRALGDEGTYAIGKRVEHDDGSYTDEGITFQEGWGTIDKVLHPETKQFYSTKPPLLPTLLAGEYLLIKHIPTFHFSRDEGVRRSGQLTFSEHPQAVVRTILVMTNLAPLVIFLVLYSRMLERLAPEAWTRGYAMVAAAVGTYLTGFSVTLNNHTVAAFSSFFALYPALLVWSDERRDWWLFAPAGLFAGFSAVTELPATALAAALGLGLFWKAPVRTLQWFVPLGLIPVAGHFAANYAAYGSLRPAYANKQWYDFDGSYWKIDPESGRLVGTKKDPTTGATVIDQSGIDSQYEPWYGYLFHMLLGHHGIFSLSPIFIFTVVGLIRVAGCRGSPLRAVALLTSGLTVLLLAFYTIAPAFALGQRNYGGMCNGLRWLFWLIPLWLVFLPAGLEPKASCRWLRGLALAFLIVSAASAFYATRNPWTRPWLQEVMFRVGWINY